MAGKPGARPPATPADGSKTQDLEPFRVSPGGASLAQTVPA
ncbi:hypothetical protein PQR67_23015 [Paraburkholderia fungorum]